MDVDRLHEGTRAHVVQESMLLARTYERWVPELVYGHKFVKPQQ